MKNVLSAALLFFVFALAGCGFFQKNFSSSSAPYGRELIYDRAPDFTYLVVVDAINESTNWELYFTDKRSGKILAYDSRYKEVMNPDDRVVTILIKPLGRRKTSVSLDKHSVNKLRAHEILDAIERRMTEMNQVLQAGTV